MLLTLIYRSTNAKVVCIKFHSIYRCTSGNPEWKSGYNSIMLYITHINTIPRICKCIRTRTLEDYVWWQTKAQMPGSVSVYVCDRRGTYVSRELPDATSTNGARIQYECNHIPFQSAAPFSGPLSLVAHTVCVFSQWNVMSRYSTFSDTTTTATAAAATGIDFSLKCEM